MVVGFKTASHESAHSRFQSEYGRLLIRARINRWQGHSRLGTGEAALLSGQLNDPATD